VVSVADCYLKGKSKYWRILFRSWFVRPMSSALFYLREKFQALPGNRTQHLCALSSYANKLLFRDWNQSLLLFSKKLLIYSKQPFERITDQDHGLPETSSKEFYKNLIHWHFLIFFSISGLAGNHWWDANSNKISWISFYKFSFLEPAGDKMKRWYWLTTQRKISSLI
jgi:hypothetical protein